jgi:deazaflavin-dependent oxidoreductase (nitroreductase family)
MTVVELHATGRTSGLPRSTILTAPVVDGDRIVLVASKGGDDRNPEWFANVVANPDVELSIEGRRRAMRARVATDDEREELWPQVIRAYKGYGGYRAHVTRDPDDHLRTSLNARVTGDSLRFSAL